MANPPESLSSFFDAKTKTFITFVLVLNGLLFVWSNNSDGAGVHLVVHSHINESLRIGNISRLQGDIYDKEVYSFTLLSAVKDFWSSRSYALSVLIAAFSGFWPYIKLILLMFAWLQPMQDLTRSRLLFFLDQFGKFSLVDLYVCVYMIVSFYFNINQPSPSSPFHKYVDVRVNVIVNPKLGMYTFVIGTLASVFVNHFMIWLDETRRFKPYQRLVVDGQIREQVPRDKTPGYEVLESHDKSRTGESDVAHSAAIPTDISEDRLTSVSPLFFRVPAGSGCGVMLRSFMLVWMLFILWATIQSCFASPVRFSTGGLAGAFADDPVRAYNLLQVIEKVPHRTQPDFEATAYFLDVVFAATLVAFPLAVSMLCFVIWFIPLSGRVCRFLGVFVLPLNSLAAIEVFWMAGIAASLELELVSKWIIDQNKSFSGVCGNIQAITHLDCFSVKGTLLDGCWWMLVAGFGLWSVVWYTRYNLNCAFGVRDDSKADPVYYDVDFGVD